MILPAFVVAVSLLGQFPLSTQVELPTGETAFLGADFLRYDPARQLLTTEGNVILKTAQAMVRADAIEWDQGANRAVARGKVMFVSGMMTAIADEVTVDINSEEATLKGALFMQKQGVAPEVLLAAKTPQELKDAGQTVVSISGTKIKRLGKNAFAVEGLSFTPCDCDPKEPTWRVEASSAEVELGEKAWLTFPRVYIQQLPIPVFALPFLYLPLAERRTGLLLPAVYTGGLNGWGFDQPVFITLGRSYDATVTPGYYFGAREERLIVGDQVVGTRLPPHGVAGPRVQNEFRYVPSQDTSGRLSLGLLYDLRPYRDPINPLLPPRPVGEPGYYNPPFDPVLLEQERRAQRRRGLRGELSWQHTQQLTPTWHARADASLVSDGYLNRDVTADLIAAQDQYLRSTGTLFHRTADLYAGLEVVLRQDLRWGHSAFGLDRDPNGQKLRGVSTLQRLPGLRFSLPERRLIGPIFAGGHAELVRLSPILSQTGDEGLDGIWRPDDVADTAQSNGRFDSALERELPDGSFQELAGEREARLRLSLRPEVSAELPIGKVARVSPYAGYRQDLYLGEVTGSLSHRGYPIAGVFAESELSRSFGKDQGLRHLIVPSAELRYVPGLLLGGRAVRPLARAYDEVDVSVAREGILQGNAELSQRLMLRQGAVAREAVRLDLGQNFDLKRGRLGDTYARFTTEVPNFTAACTVRYDLAASNRDDRLTQLYAHARIDNGKGSFLFGEYNNLLQGGSDRLRRGLDELVGAPYELPEGAPARSRAELINAGVSVQLPFGLGGRYTTQVGRRAVVGAPEQTELGLNFHEVAVSYGPACDCWRLEVRAVFRPDLDPEVRGTLTLARFGSFGT